MKDTTYSTPSISYYDLEFSQFICISIKDMSFTDEVDEYVNVSDGLTFDSDF